ncbi:hypothetical protein J1N35_043092 [Gossypium stocksii]|uniref:Reverse transcriptase domain-containing protein n=1 Tax=Gossypium stocksii TaxID=47602 RepID=A0A9D3U6R5_9ROSI|nr:hypothetical protein J1N35_043092 [Gossypium stocksii]
MEQVRRSCGLANGIDVDADGSIGDPNDRKKWRFTSFYGSHYAQDSDESWNLLKTLWSNEELPWFVCRDFNEIMYGFEKNGGLPRDERRMEGEFIRNKYSRALGQMHGQRELDVYVPEATIQHLVHLIFDHHPLLITMEKEDNRRSWKSFKFEAWWVLEESFDAEVKFLWEMTIGGLLQKLDYLKKGLERWAAGEKGHYEHLLTGIGRCISEEDNQRLTAQYTKKEVWKTLTSMGATKALGKDRFSALFFQKCWHIIGDEVALFCLQHLNKGIELNPINTMHIMLIPKKANPTNLTHFLPISLCNVIYKIMAMAIAIRFRRVLEKCIENAQSAFVSGRKKGLMTGKLDMSKAYDRVEWMFVHEMMRRIGFDPNWIDSIIKCWYLMVKLGIFFNQREDYDKLILPYETGTSRRTYKGVKENRRRPQVSHLLLADDCILFGEATERGAGQHINFDKSTVFFSTNTQEEDKQLVTRILEVRSSNDPERYLGLHNMVGRGKKESFQNLKDRFKQRIDNWSIRHLSQYGKEVFIKAILQVIPTYTMAYFLLPKSLCADLKSIIVKFWWQNDRGKRGIHWYA